MRKFAPDANGYEKRLERLGSSRFSLSISAVEITDTTAPEVRPAWPEHSLLGQCVHALSKLRLAVRCLVAVNNTLGHSLVQLAGGRGQEGFRFFGIAGFHGKASLTDVGLQFRLNGLVAKATLLVRQNALLLLLDISQ